MLTVMANPPHFMRTQVQKIRQRSTYRNDQHQSVHLKLITCMVRCAFPVAFWALVSESMVPASVASFDVSAFFSSSIA